MCGNFKCLSSQVGTDAGLFHPAFFSDLYFYYFYTSIYLTLGQKFVPIIGRLILINDWKKAPGFTDLLSHHENTVLSYEL